MCAVPKIVTKREAAEILGVDVSTVQKMISDGILVPYQTFDGPRRASLHLFRFSDVERIRRARAAA